VPDILVIFISLNSEACNLHGSFYASAKLASKRRKPVLNGALVERTYYRFYRLLCLSALGVSVSIYSQRLSNYVSTNSN
jgi:hypothetical protein